MGEPILDKAEERGRLEGRAEERQEMIMSALQNKMPKEDMKKYLTVKDEEVVEAERSLKHKTQSI